MYPHQVLMEQNNLQPQDLTPEARDYLKDFNTFIRAVNMKQGKAEKAGKEFEMSEKDINKAKRLSKSVCVQIYEDLDVKAAEQKAEEEKEQKAREEAQAIKEAQEREEKEKQEALKRQVEEQQRIKEEAEEQARAFAREQAEREEQERRRVQEENDSFFF